MDTFGYIKMKNCSSTYIINAMERQATEWESIFAIYTTSEGLNIEYISNFWTSNRKKIKSNKNGQELWT